MDSIGRGKKSNYEAGMVFIYILETFETIKGSVEKGRKSLKSTRKKNNFKLSNSLSKNYLNVNGLHTTKTWWAVEIYEWIL